MCGRFALATEKHVLEMLYQLEIREDLQPHFNVAPGRNILGIRASADDLGREASLFRWGLIPFWADDPAIGSRMINARSETAAEKPSFRSAYRKRRLLIPASGFYEWKKSGQAKQPYYVSLKGGGPFSFAGLWERWEKGEESLESCTILTTGPNALLKDLHERMPVIIRPEDYRDWLDPATPPDSVAGFLKPYPSEELNVYPVSTMVNKPVNNSPDLIKPIGK